MSNEIIVPQGDDVTITASIDDASGNDLDLTGATVTFVVSNSSGTTVISKTATITDAGTGAISVAIADTDTSSLSGVYIYKLKVEDNSGNFSTVRVRHFFVVTNQNIIDKEQVRVLLGDTDTTDQILTDAQIYFFVVNNSNVYTAAAKAARAVQSNFARLADTTIEGVSVKYSQKAVSYGKLAKNLESLASQEDIPTPSVLGVNTQTMENKRNETDRFNEKFFMDRFSNPPSFDNRDYGAD